LQNRTLVNYIKENLSYSKLLNLRFHLYKIQRTFQIKSTLLTRTSSIVQFHIFFLGLAYFPHHVALIGELSDGAVAHVFRTHGFVLLRAHLRTHALVVITHLKLTASLATTCCRYKTKFSSI